MAEDNEIPKPLPFNLNKPDKSEPLPNNKMYIGDDGKSYATFAQLVEANARWRSSGEFTKTERPIDTLDYIGDDGKRYADERDLKAANEAYRRVMFPEDLTIEKNSQKVDPGLIINNSLNNKIERPIDNNLRNKFEPADLIMDPRDSKVD